MFALEHIFTTPSTGGTPVDITPIPLSSGSFTWPSWSPNGNEIAAQFEPSGDNTGIAIISATPSTLYMVTSPSNYNDSNPVFSPDGSKIAFYRSNLGGATPGIYVEDATGVNQQLVTQLPTGASPDMLCWSPFPAALTYVPNSSFSASAVSGFVLTQNGSQFGSLLGFMATTPSAATITTSPTLGNQPLVFTLSADAITNIVYTNAYYTYATAVTPPASTPSGATDLVLDPKHGSVLSVH